ncbi:MAG: hypothetical protein LBM03_01790 [Erysipelotrichaceae bacterium]|jgi:hypothetical protein|nr:hypothetical protein [Erysipelotrichaceae bacterium]
MIEKKKENQDIKNIQIEENRFDIPVCLFTFRRLDTVLRIIDVLRKVKPTKVYLFSDYGRDEEEKKQIDNIRPEILKAFDWDCEVIKMFADENIGVFNSIAMGALKVFKKEKTAIFLEDDNLPALSFFAYCKELLTKYENDPKVVWICGTNYLSKYSNKNNDSYMFSKEIFPCGWASWANKFSKYYDTTLEFVDEKGAKHKYKKLYKNKSLAARRWYSIYDERNRFLKKGKFNSWDSHMAATIRNNDLYGISPAVNLIQNIGNDNNATHFSTTKIYKIMNDRLCKMPKYELDFPLTHPSMIEVDKDYEKKTDKVFIFPFGYRCKTWIVSIVKTILRIPRDKSIRTFLKRKSKSDSI